ncbi:hypothetical protein UG55_101425, partial [Frankia sp. EI5c]
RFEVVVDQESAEAKAALSDEPAVLYA